MDEIGFRNWLTQSGLQKKQVQDSCSRVKKLEKAIYPVFEIETEYRKNRCSELLSLFDAKGHGFDLRFESIDLPIDKYYLAAYKMALSKYILFLDFTQAKK